MEAQILRDRIASTLTADANVRRQAELDLRHVRITYVTIVFCRTNLVSGRGESWFHRRSCQHTVRRAGQWRASGECVTGQINSSYVSADSRVSAVVYLKNRVRKAWNPSDDYPVAKRISPQEKGAFRQRLIPLIASSPANIRAQLVPTLQTILHTDFPQNWPGIFDITVQLLGAADADSVYTGLQCILGICRVYRFKSGENRADFEKVVAMCFPQLLVMGDRLVHETSLEAGEMLRAIMKAFKHTIYFELPNHLREQTNIVAWCTLFLHVVSKDPPASAMVVDLDEREINHWFKAKKWAYGNLNRLFVRYGNPTTLQKNNGEEYAAFSKLFLESFAPEILKVYLQQIEKWVAKSVWLSKAALSYTLTYLDECVKPKTMWTHLKPSVETLISHLVFPVLCQSDEDLELFESDPPEYLSRKLNFYEQVSAPDMAAINFLISLTKHRRKQTFVVLTFINGIVNRYEAAPDDQKNAREKEGALRMIGTLASVILGKKSPIADQVEYFFVRHVFPEFRSPHGFLRARACETLEKFEQLEFKDQNNLILVYRNILQSMADEELPVRVEAALALQPLIRHEVIRESMRQNIPQIMQQLLKLANEVDVDALANVMEDFVESFSTELTPFAVALTEQLRDTYLRIVRELVERADGKDDEDSFGFLDDKSVTALGVLQTIGTLILTLESTPDVLLQLEELLMPLIQTTLDNKLYDLYTEVFEIIDSCTFASKSISLTMWQAFELMHKAFKAGAELYLDDMLPALENYIQFGPAHMAQNPAYIEAVVEMVRDIFEDSKVNGMDRIAGCKLAEALMLSLRGLVDEHIGEFIRLAMTVLTNSDVAVKSLRVHLIETIINAIYYNPQLTLSILEMSGTTNRFFGLWFQNIEAFTRVHDKKLSIAAITSLITLPPQSVPQSVQPGWPRLLQGLVKLFETLPQAIKNREEAKKENEFELNSEFEDDDEEEEWPSGADWTNDDAEEVEDVEDIKDESAAYLDFLNEEVASPDSTAGDVC